jgi:hypothetical protein
VRIEKGGRGDGLVLWAQGADGRGARVVDAEDKGRGRRWGRRGWSEGNAAAHGRLSAVGGRDTCVKLGEIQMVLVWRGKRRGDGAVEFKMDPRAKG